MKAQQRMSSAVEEFFEAMFEVFMEKMTAAISGAKAGGSRALDMACRVPGCKERSGGPRNRYFCKTHQALSRAEQDKHLALYRASRQ